MRDLSEDRVSSTCEVLVGIPEERDDVAHRGHADAEDVRIFGGVNQLVQQRRVETVLQADTRWVRRARKRHGPAIREGPVRAGYLSHAPLDAALGFGNR